MEYTILIKVAYKVGYLFLHTHSKIKFSFIRNNLLKAPGNGGPFELNLKGFKMSTLRW